MIFEFSTKALHTLRRLPRKERRTMAWALSGHIAEKHLNPLQLMTLGILRLYQRQAADAV
ncbi:MAG: hypothetical protein K2L74_08815 [Muribaculaceae bacterium]|nr:hypothetical protein [Muribaculaceae bacterium]MDE6542101.1 hypothetical protein [Muribaculaceae bacterium]